MSKPGRTRAASVDPETDEGSAERALYLQRIANVSPPAVGQLPRPLGAAARLGGVMGTVASRFATFWLLFLMVFLLVLWIGFGDVMGEMWFPMLFLLLFVAVGVALLMLGIKQGLRDIRLLQNGLLTWALVTDVERHVSTSRDSDGRTSTSVTYHVHFLYGTQDGEVWRRRLSMDRADAVTDEALELLIYDPAKPSVCQFADKLPGGLRLGADGVASSHGFGTAMGVVQACLICLSFVVMTTSYTMMLFTEPKPRTLPNFNREQLEPPFAER
jgi:hypothetical protein